VSTILVVEDHAISRQMLGALLGYVGHRVLEAADGSTALQVAHGSRPDLVVLDVMLPGADGFTLLRALRADADLGRTPVLVYSAACRLPDDLRLVETNASLRVLPKPSEPEVILNTIGAMLGGPNGAAAAELRTPSGAKFPPGLRSTALRLPVLVDLGLHLVRERDPATLLTVFARALAELAGGARSAVVLADNDPDRPEQSPVERLGSIFRGGTEPHADLPSAAILQHVLETRAAVRCEVAAQPGRSARARLVLPFATPGRVHGWIVLDGADASPFANTDEELAGALSAQAAIAHENIILMEQMREAARRKDEFLAVLSHELRNPLAPVRNSLHVLSRVAPGGDAGRRALAVIDRQTAHLARLVDDLLDVTRIARGKIRLRTEPADLRGIVQRTVEDHRSVFASAGVDLEVHLPEDALPVCADSTRLSQVVGILLSNAAKFTPRGGRASVTAERDGRGGVRVRVADTGAGLAPETMRRLFEPFVQADSTLDRSAGGLGLGLSIAKKLLELHGGSIVASSAGPGAGAEFVFTLPLGAEAVAGQAAPEPRPAKRRVLVIEDGDDAAESLRDALELGGHVVEVAADGPAGLEAARVFRPEVVLCDIGLPGMDGYEVARALRADPATRNVRLVALTGYAAPDDEARAREAGFDVHVAKPPSIGAIEELLADAPAPSDALAAVGRSG